SSQSIRTVLVVIPLMFRLQWLQDRQRRYLPQHQLRRPRPRRPQHRRRAAARQIMSGDCARERCRHRRAALAGRDHLMGSIRSSIIRTRPGNASLAATFIAALRFRRCKAYTFSGITLAQSLGVSVGFLPSITMALASRTFRILRGNFSQPKSATIHYKIQPRSVRTPTMSFTLLILETAAF